MLRSTLRLMLAGAPPMLGVAMPPAAPAPSVLFDRTDARRIALRYVATARAARLAGAGRHPDVAEYLDLAGQWRRWSVRGSA